jgi:hypothetical protein
LTRTAGEYLEWIDRLIEDLPSSAKENLADPKREKLIPFIIGAGELPAQNLIVLYNVDFALRKVLTSIPGIGDIWSYDLSQTIVALAAEKHTTVGDVIMNYSEMLLRTSGVRELLRYGHDQALRVPTRAAIRELRQWWIEEKKLDGS